MSRPCPATIYERLTNIAYYFHNDTTISRPIDIGSFEYLWRIKDQFLGVRFTKCYKGPEYFTLGRAEQRRRVEIYRKRRADEFWYMMRAFGREIRWKFWTSLGFRPWGP